MKILIRHTTSYLYERLVYLTPHILRLKPAAHSPIPIDSFSLKIKPANTTVHSLQDPFGNFLYRVDFDGPVQELQIEAVITADFLPFNPFNFFIDEAAQHYPFEYDKMLKKDLCPFLGTPDEGSEFLNWINETDSSKQEIVGFLLMITGKIYKQISYTTRMEAGVQSCETSLHKATGSCRDSAWLLVQSLRHLGLAARFVSGHLVQISKDNLENTVEDSVSLHAWAEVYIPGAGWIGLDPTSGQLAGEGYIPLACTPHPESAAAVTGTSEANKTNFSFNSTVTRLSNRRSL